jgi:hypothetical protein
MTAKEAYADFLRDLLAWLPGQVGSDTDLLFMIRGAVLASRNDWEYEMRFPGPGRRKAYLFFAKNMFPPYDIKSKVFAVGFSIGAKLNYDWLKTEATRMLPGGECDKYYNGKGDVFFVQTEWCKEGERDLLYSSPVRARLFQYSLDALRFAKHALDHAANIDLG